MIRRRLRQAMLTVMMLCILCVGSVLAKDDKSSADEVTVLFTHDIHSHLDEFRNADGKVGGFARLKTLLDEERGSNPATFVFDGGDFSMGTLYQTVYETEAAELTMLGRLGYDATTFGNHEFDYRSEGISHMFHSALENAGDDPSIVLPKFVTANIDWEKNDTEDNRLIRDALEDYGSTPYAIVEREGVRIGVFGVLGEDAEACAPESGLEFEPIVEASEEVVKELEKEGADMIVCLSHSGTNEEEDKSEDEILAKKVPEIDVIVSAHTHTKLDKHIKSGDTYIVSAGCYGEYLGDLKMTPTEDGRWNLDEYTLHHLDESVSPDEKVNEELDIYKKLVNEEYLSRFDYTFDQVLADNSVAFTQMDRFALEVEEDPLGSIIADAYVYAVEQAEGADYDKVDVAVVPSGTIRDTLQIGALTVSDAFNVCSLGIGADRIPGYPLVSVYLTGAELKTAAEIDVSVSPIMTTAQLYPSGLHWTYNPNRMMLNRVTEAALYDDLAPSNEKKAQELKDDRLYRVVAGLYSAQMLGAVEDTSKGLLKITPKDKDGVEIKDFEQHIIHDKNGAELKEWYALARYLESFDKSGEGISQIPQSYGRPEGRKEEVDSKNIIELVKQPNKFAFIVYGAAICLILIIVLVVRFIIKRRKKKKNMIY
ncbi:bifunctional metallophosphatase/5'-nucleotidase [Extibacter muris]|uniref:Bifunctional metallophosphatase/5'-nucleotidase n=2 Tax=Extibacter muris TaxID=1796622 RepID=A0A4R4FFJ6_9FIRM|nr:bifunctional metallophosphatase/5'-nucleotidase [Extibacter muris]